MNEDRILTLAESLEQANPDNFHIAQWLRTDDCSGAPRYFHNEHLSTSTT